MANSVTKFLVIRDSTNSGAIANLTSGSITKTVFKTSGGTDMTSSLTATIVDATHGLIALTYDPSGTNLPAGGYITLSGTTTTLIAGDANPAFFFDIEETNAVQVNGVSTNNVTSIAAYLGWSTQDVAVYRGQLRTPHRNLLAC